MKRICWRRAEPGYHTHMDDADLTYGGQEVGHVRRNGKDGHYWVVFGDKLGIKTHNSLWKEGSYPTAAAAKEACVAYVKEAMKGRKE